MKEVCEAMERFYKTVEASIQLSLERSEAEGLID